jgi:hypothetical protein
MRALCWMGVNDLQVHTVRDPPIVNRQGPILKVRLTTTCGSDLDGEESPLHLLTGERAPPGSGRRVHSRLPQQSPNPRRPQVAPYHVAGLWVPSGRLQTPGK